jgi:hypothetical protein
MFSTSPCLNIVLYIVPNSLPAVVYTRNYKNRAKYLRDLTLHKYYFLVICQFLNPFSHSLLPIYRQIKGLIMFPMSFYFSGLFLCYQGSDFTTRDRNNKIRLLLKITHRNYHQSTESYHRSCSLFDVQRDDTNWD